MPAPDPPPTLDALTTLCTSVLQWNERLDALNGQIALRQTELARLEEYRPPTRSLRNKGSTESLRPRDGPADPEGEPPAETRPEKVEPHSSSPPRAPKLYQNPGQRPSSATPAKTAAQTGAAFTSPPQPFTTTPQKSPSLNTRPSSHPSTPAPARPGPAKLQKRKTASIMSGDSATPKYRTRSMIIVYYDSAVQSAFEELVKFVSGSRNAMRKGRMAARMAEMRRAAEMEVDADGESETDDDGLPQLSSAVPRKSTLAAARNGEPSAGSELELDVPPGAPLSEGLLRRSVPRFTSGRYGVLQADGLRSLLSANVMKRSADGEQDIFEKIDKTLEWCQGHCEFAAHKFLREGECGTEIGNIKNKLSEIRACAEREVERLKADETTEPPKGIAQPNRQEDGKSRDQRPIQVRKSALETMKDLEVDKISLDKMEVDDEGFEDMDPSALVFARSKDFARSRGKASAGRR